MTYRTSRPLILTAVALALLGAGALASPSAARASRTGAAIPPAYLQMIDAMNSAQSYKLVSDSTSNGGDVMHMEWVSVRHGKLTQRYVAMDSKRGARHTIGQIVVTGTHVCIRQSSAGAWNCRLPAALAAAYSAAGSMDPRTLEASGLHMDIGMSPAGRKAVQQQMCLGYNITMSMTTSSYTGTTHGTYWLNTVTGRPVEMDTSSAITIGGTKSTTAQKAVWSNWNDPTLVIPAVPVS